MIVGLYTDPPTDAVEVCTDEPGPILPRSFAPGPTWSPDGRRIKAPLYYARGPDKAWVYGALRIADGTALMMAARPATAPWRWYWKTSGRSLLDMSRRWSGYGSEPT
ncbi:hypothetical protein [Nonomuraea rubra]|uniref:Uncharacterized protein n=1 Tax=Nonomuraea rubra TaxID=46180 RepID=A0A7X0TX13_9ACTN|nr:hypothetical protein [Nonomuraea rubra]MBB6546928.1 hypothetical protein [Nonomuraea rubra]